MWKKVLAGIAGVALLLVVAVAATAAYVLRWPDFGGAIEGERLARMQASPQWSAPNAAFTNNPPQPAEDYWVNVQEAMGDQVRQPPGPFPQRRPQLVDPPPPGLRATWFGHATVLVEIDGVRVLTDPMLSDEAFPVSLIAPERLNPPPVALADLPRIDVVTVSHDHYDHLDMATIQHLAARGTHFFVGLGIGAHLERWGVASDQIHELDWWESDTHAGLTVHCTPARHYSGRRAIDNSTLWSSWVLQGPAHRVFHSGDSGYAGHFAEIGEKRGPIDLSLIKIGDYGQDPAWESIHMVAEDSVQAHLDLGATTLLPIHWGTFELSFHDWDEPIRRARAAADQKGAQMVTPRLGETYTHGEPFASEAWWEDLGASGAEAPE